MTEQTRRPQSRMVPALAAALVGVLLGALVVLTGVLAGQRGGCCCNCYGSVCGEIRSGAATPFDPTPSRPTPGAPPGCHGVERHAERQLVPPASPWIRPELQRHDVPLPGSLALMGAGLLAWRLS